jgi:ParB/Sulfiredoxin domain
MTMVAIERIDVGQRLRDICEDRVKMLIDSITEVGLLTPIAVYRCKVVRDHVFVDGFGLVAGRHRLEGCRRVGMTEIPVHVVEMPELKRQLAECDENLCGTNLGKAERALFTKRRKQIYEALHPETARGAVGRTGYEKSRQLGDSNEAAENIVRFTKETAARTGRSERDIQRDADRGGKIGEAVLSRVRGTHLDKGSYLDKLKEVPPAEQRRKVEDDLSREKAKERRADAAERIEAEYQRLEKAWEAASAPARVRFSEARDREFRELTRKHTAAK